MFRQLGQNEGEKEQKNEHCVAYGRRRTSREKQKREKERRKKKNRSKNDYENGQFGRHENSDGLKHALHPRDFICKWLFYMFVIKLVKINQFLFFFLHLFSFSRFSSLHLSLYTCNIYLEI